MKIARLVCTLLAIAASGVSACSSARDSASSSQPARPASAAPSDAEVDIAEVAKRNHFSFREEDQGGALVGGHRSYVAKVSREGSVRFSPRWRPKKDRIIQVGEPSLTLSTAGVEREHPLPLLAPRVSVGTTGAALVDRGSVVERILNDAAGVEQSWQVPARPRGHGDLVVRVDLDTTGRVEVAGSALRVVDDATGRAVRYGNVAWVDASGTRTELTPAWVEGRIVLRVPDEVIERSTYPAVLDPTITPETAIDDPLVDIPGFWWANPVVAPGKNGSFLVAWIDERVFSVDDNLYFGSGQVYGARIAADGTVLDPTAFAIAPTRDFDLGEVQLAFDGTQWLASWTQYPYNGPCTQMVATRVSETGAVLDRNNLHITCAGGNTASWLGWDGSAFLVVWRGQSLVTASTPALFGQYVTPSGELGKTVPFAIADPMASQDLSGIQVACDGVNECLVVQPGASGLHGRRVVKGGIVSADLPFTTTASDRPLGVSYDGTSFVVGYQSGTTTRALRIVPSTGAVLDAGGIAISTELADWVSSMNGQTLFAWRSTSPQISGVRLSSAGGVLDASPLVLTSGATVANQGSVAASGNQWLLAWDDDRGGPDRDTIYTGRVSSAGAPLDGSGKILRLAANGQRTPAAAGDANGWLVAFEDLRTRDYYASIRFTRLGPNGSPLAANSVELAPIGNSPSVGYDGTGWFVTYSDSSCFNCCGNDFGHTISSTGLVSPPIGIGAGAGCKLAPRTIYDGTNFAVVWQQGGNIMFQRFSKTGTPVDAQPVVVGGNFSGFAGDAGIATNGQEYFVAWSAYSSPNTSVVGARVSKTGTVIDSPPIVITTGPFDIYNPKVAFDGKSYLVAWQDYRATFYTNPDIYLSRVSTDGKVLDPNGRPLAEGPLFQAWPAIIPMNDGVTALIAWSEPRRTDRFRDFGVFGTFMRIDDGTFLDPGGIPLADLEGNELFAAFAARSPGNVMLLYQRDDTTNGFGAERIRARFVSSGTLLGQACTSNDQCGSRACADGICCDAPCKGVCQTCTATPGKCTPVVNADDGDTCAGENVCDGAGACKKKTGQSCTVPTDCVSGFCADGICCESACSGSCETCSAPPGKCTLRGAREIGVPRCAPYACTGTSGACPSRCDSDDACPTTARCDVSTGACVEGSYCIDSKTLGGNGPIPTTCAPYTCESAACRTTCRDVHDCIYPAVCNESGSCVQPPTSTLELIESGCAVSRGRTSRAHWAHAFGAVAFLLFAARRRYPRPRSD